MTDFCFDHNGRYQLNWYRNPKNAKILEEVIAKTSFLPPDSPVSQRAWHVVNAVLEPFLCAGGNPVTFMSFNGGYRKHCSDKKNCECWKDIREQSSSVMRDNHTSGKIKRSFLEKYGVETPSAVPGVKEKISSANKQRSGAAFEKRAATMLSKYGVVYGFQLDSCKALHNNRKKAVATYLERYGVENPMQLPEFREKARRTSLAKYGADNPMKVAVFKEKAKKTSIARYGVENPLQSKEIQAKVRKTNIERYGSENSSSAPGIRAKIRTGVYTYYHPDTELTAEEIELVYTTLNSEDWWAEQTIGSANSFLNTYFNSPRTKYLHILRNRPDLLKTFVSIPHKNILDFLDSLGVEYQVNSRSIIPPKEIDIWLPEYNLGIEVNGIYWHCEESGGKGPTYHVSKLNECEQRGYSLLGFTDGEILNKPDIVQNIIRMRLNKISSSIGARSCEVVLVEQQQAKEFLTKYHIQGVISGEQLKTHGLMYSGELVAVMSIGAPRFSRTHDWEILRFCVKGDLSVPGGFNKLFKSFDLKGKIISYVSRSYFSGKSYKKTGWQFKHYSSPAYFYTNNYLDLHSRFKFQKHKLKSKLEHFNPVLTEWENMKENGWDRIWDYGNLVFEKEHA